MGSKPAAQVKPAAADSLEKIAYTSVAGIQTIEAHDQDRLGYNVYEWLKRRRGTLEEAVHSAGARMRISEEEAVQQIREKLKQQGVEL